MVFSPGARRFGNELQAEWAHEEMSNGLARALALDPDEALLHERASSTATPL